jgi:hypothetical protein
LEIEVKIDEHGTYQDFNDVIAEREAWSFFESTTLRLHPAPTASSLSLKGKKLNLKQILSQCSIISPLYEITSEELSSKLACNLHTGESIMNLQTGEALLVELRIQIDAEILNNDQLRCVVKKYRDKYPDLRRWRFSSIEKAWNKAHIVFNNCEEDGDDLSDLRLLHSPQAITSTNPPRTFRDFRTLLGPATSSLATKSHYLSAPVDNLYFSEVSMQYIGMFLLGSLVRYRPQTWVFATTRLASPERSSDDMSLALIEKFMESVHHNFLNLTSQLLTGST